MKLALQRAVDKWIGMPLCALLSAFERVRPPRAVVATSVEAGVGGRRAGETRGWGAGRL